MRIRFIIPELSVEIMIFPSVLTSWVTWCPYWFCSFSGKRL